MYLDTHVVIWLYQKDEQRISRLARELIESSDLLVSPMVLPRTGVPVRDRQDQRPRGRGLRLPAPHHPDRCVQQAVRGGDKKVDRHEVDP